VSIGAVPMALGGQEVAARVEELWAAGAGRVELGTPRGRTTRAGVKLICSHVLPLLRR